ncbi:MAG: hypothetical protein OXH70_16105 [Acidobacteria bacterium]|nr:hypothetical protein [Acidobacteriota bacterium]
MPTTEPEDKVRPRKGRRSRQGPAREAHPEPETSNRREAELVSRLHESVAALGPTAVTTLLAHPDTIRSALATAVRVHLDEPLAEEVETVAGPPAALLDHAEAERRLSRRTRAVQNEDGELLTTEEFARRAGARSRQSVHNWLRKGRIVGWEGAKRGFVFPAEQLDERGRPLNGLGGVVPHFEGRYSAWCWLRDRNGALDGARPIDLLRRNDVARVESAARGYAQGDFG